MGRQLRPMLPGMPFHITARAQWQEPVFRGVEAEVVRLICDSIDRSDAHLVAYAVMANHIHVVVVQGRRPLAAYMQPMLRRIALLVRGQLGRAGHVFQGRYRHSACQDADYFRTMVAYVHLNPVRAGICRRPEDYAWTSHADYAVGCSVSASARYTHGVERGLRIFARRSEQSSAECRRDYRAFARWRIAFDDYLEDDGAVWRAIPRPPQSIGGDAQWYRDYGSATALRMTGASLPRPRTLDLRDHVRQLLDDVAPDLALNELCSGGRSRPLVRVRNHVIARAITAGYQTTKLARFLNISPSVVSNVRAALREGTSG